MPRPNARTEESEVFAQRLVEEREALLDLIKWIAPRIQRRNGNGGLGETFCLLCVMGQPQFKRMPCRHAEIWRIANDAR